MFLSYSRQDGRAAAAIAATLRIRGVDVWWDKWEMGNGGSPVATTGEDAGALVVVLISEHSRKTLAMRDSHAAVTAGAAGRAGAVCIMPAVLDKTPVPRRWQSRPRADFRASHACGCARIIQAVGREDPFGGIEDAVVDAMSMLEATGAAKAAIDPRAIPALRAIVRHRATGFEHSCSALAGQRGRRRSLQVCNRDFVQLLIYEHVVDALAQDSPPTLYGLLDSIYAICCEQALRGYDDHTRSYVASDSTFIAADIRRIFTVICDPAKGPG